MTDCSFLRLTATAFTVIYAIFNQMRVTSTTVNETVVMDSPIKHKFSSRVWNLKTYTGSRKYSVQDSMKLVSKYVSDGNLIDAGTKNNLILQFPAKANLLNCASTFESVFDPFNLIRHQRELLSQLSMLLYNFSSVNLNAFVVPTIDLLSTYQRTLEFGEVFVLFAALRIYISDSSAFIERINLENSIFIYEAHLPCGNTIKCTLPNFNRNSQIQENLEFVLTVDSVNSTLEGEAIDSSSAKLPIMMAIDLIETIQTLWPIMKLNYNFLTPQLLGQNVTN